MSCWLDIVFPGKFIALRGKPRCEVAFKPVGWTGWGTRTTTPKSYEPASANYLLSALPEALKTFYVTPRGDPFRASLVHRVVHRSIFRYPTLFPKFPPFSKRSLLRACCLQTTETFLASIWLHFYTFIWIWRSREGHETIRWMWTDWCFDPILEDVIYFEDDTFRYSVGSLDTLTSF